MNDHDDVRTTKRIVSWGGGTQSSAISLMVLRGLLPRPDLFLFADTGDEPTARDT